MPKSQFIDFKAVKSAITMEQLLQHYSLLDQFKRSGDSLSGPCPIHKGTNPTQFRVSVSKNIWNCFSECKHGGNTLDFIARMENVTVHKAALKAIEWFNVESESSDEPDSTEAEAPRETKLESRRTAEPTALATPNKPLKFKLDKLQHEHPYLLERGLTLETLVTFGAGYCAKGMMAERIAIPIHNVEGQIVAYAGRFPGEPAEDTPKYKLPQGFRKSQEVFNLDRALQEPPEQPLVIVEGFFGCMHLYQHGCRRVVALMGSTLSATQEELLRHHTQHRSKVIVILDEDEAGRAGREDIAVRLSRFVFVQVYAFEQEGQQPENMNAEQVAALLH